MNGVLVADKPGGPTSHDVVAFVRRFTRPSKTGHTGTLDPMATGVLPVCVGTATRLARFLGAGAKEYTGAIALGARTDTYDAQGSLVEERPVGGIREEDVRRAASGLTGEILQAPPPWSAKHVGGERAYRLAREGKLSEMAPVKVRVDLFEISRVEGPIVTFRVACSRGTYVRSLAHDLGQRLGCGAHLAELRRTRTGPFEQSQSHGLPEIERAGRDGRLGELLIPPEELDLGIPTARVSEAGERLAGHGRGVPAGEVLEGFPAVDGETVRLLAPSGRLLAVAEYRAASGDLQPKIVLGHP